MSGGVVCMAGVTWRWW